MKQKRINELTPIPLTYGYEFMEDLSVTQNQSHDCTLNRVMHTLVCII